MNGDKLVLDSPSGWPVTSEQECLEKKRGLCFKAEHAWEPKSWLCEPGTKLPIKIIKWEGEKGERKVKWERQIRGEEGIRRTDGGRGFCDNVLLTALPPTLTVFDREDISSHKIEVDQQGVPKGLLVREQLNFGADSLGHPVANREADFLLSEICTQENEPK